MTEYFMVENDEGERIDRGRAGGKIPLLFTEINERRICESKRKACKTELQAYFGR